MLEIKNINYTVSGKVLLASIDARFELGKISGIIGSNGAGKSTLLKVISGENHPTSGRIYLDDNLVINYQHSFPAKIRAVVSQNEAVNAEITVTEYVLLGRLIYSTGQYQLADYQSVERALAVTDSIELAHRQLYKLSGGERQRIALARALAQLEDRTGCYYGYLFLDEFSANMDIYYQQQMLLLLKKLCLTKQLAIIIIAHDLNQIINHFDYCILLKQGKRVASGHPREVLTCENIKHSYNMTTHQVTVDNRQYFIY